MRPGPSMGRGRAFASDRLRRLEFFVVASIALFVAAAAVAAMAAGGREVLHDLGRVGGTVLVAMLGLSLVNYGARAWRWQAFGRRLGLDVPFRRTLLYYVAGFAMTTTPGKVGEALRLWLLERCHGYRYDRLAPLFVADRMSDMIAILLLAVLGIAAFPQQGWLVLLALALVAALTMLFARPGLTVPVVGLCYRLSGRRARRIHARARSAARRTSRLFTPRLLLVALALSLAGWAAECLAFTLLLDALGAPLGFAAASFVFAFSASVGAVSLLPGGLGGVEATMIALLLALGVDFQTALAATLVIRLTTLWFGVGLGFLALPSALRLARGRSPGLSGRAGEGMEAGTSP